MNPSAPFTTPIFLAPVAFLRPRSLSNGNRRLRLILDGSERVLLARMTRLSHPGFDCSSGRSQSTQKRRCGPTGSPERFVNISTQLRGALVVSRPTQFLVKLASLRVVRSNSGKGRSAGNFLAAPRLDATLGACTMSQRAIRDRRSCRS